MVQFNTNLNVVKTVNFTSSAQVAKTDVDNQANQPAQTQASSYTLPKTVELTAEQWQGVLGVAPSVNPQEIDTLEAPKPPADSTDVNKPIIHEHPGGNGRTISLGDGRSIVERRLDDGTISRAIVERDGRRIEIATPRQDTQFK